MPAAAQTYQVTNLVSDGSVPATTTDANFINPWGIAPGPAFWISAEATGFNYVVTTAGASPFKIVVPAATGGSTATGTPTGSVYTGTATGFVLPNGTKATFLFCSLDGIITGWNSKLGTAGAVAEIAINNNAAGAVYTDLALVTNTNGTYILAANFGKGADIEVYDSTYASAKLTGTFSDPNLPAGYTPYSVHSVGSQVFVTYALKGSTGQPTLASGNGIVSVFDTSGNFVARAITGGNLNAPWGLAIAPAAFGVFSGDLLVGNFGDGTINAYNATNYSFQGKLTDGTGATLTFPSLWELLFGNTPTSAGNLNTLYLTAGLANQAHGLLAEIANNSTPTGTPAFGVSSSNGSISVPSGSSAQFSVSVVPTNGFSGTVTLGCLNLPTAATCTFQPGQLTVTPGAVATSSVILNTVKSYTLVNPHTLRGARTGGIAAALLLPFGAVLAFSRRRLPLRLLSLLGILFVCGAFMVGCTTNYQMPQPGPTTPPGSTQVQITATSGTVTQTAPMTVNVQ
jgi:uncharacterized protein (TIGR03118 family)